jgi:hypothetical protein
MHNSDGEVWLFLGKEDEYGQSADQRTANESGVTLRVEAAGLTIVGRPAEHD